MPFPHAPSIVLDETSREQLEGLVRASSTPQALAFRAKIVLRAAENDAPPNLQIAAEFGCSKDTVGLWRRRFAAQGLPGLQDAPRSGRPRGFPPDERVDVVSIATSQPADHNCHATRWSLDDIARTILNENHAQAMSRSTIWRILEEADLKPHKSQYWLNSHDPDFDEKARDICQLYVAAPQLYQQGRLVICCDEKTGMQILQRKHPTKPVTSGIPERREHEYIRHGTRALINSFAVPTGQIAWNLGLTRTSEDFVAHLRHAREQFPEMERYDWVLDNLNTHWSLDVCRLVAEWCDIPFDPKQLKRGADRRAFLTDPSHKHVFHFTPKHGSWLNQVELWFGVLERRFLARGEFQSAEEFEQRLTAYLQDYNAHYAHPYRWTYTGQPLVRATPFDRTRRQQQHGRAWFSRRPKLFEKLLYPPRPYQTTC